MLFIKRATEFTTRLRTPTDTSLRAFVAYASGVLRNYSSKDYSSSDDEKDTKKSVKSKKKPADAASTTAATGGETETAASKLNRLLASMKTDDPYTLAKKEEELDMARPGSSSKKRREAIKAEKDSKDIFKAVKGIANILSDEQQQKQTESELLAKLLGHTTDAEGGAAAAKSTADGGKAKTPESEMSLSELIVGMKIDRNAPQIQSTRGDYVRRTLAAARNQQPRREGLSDQNQYQQQQRRTTPRPKREAESFTGSVNLFGVEPLGIFKQPNELKDSPDMLTTWTHLHQHDLQLQVTHPPANYFEKIALWTEQGKVWRFPIDNEQDWNEEVDVDFSEHIFLEQHLEGWCPNKGPIRHFMELVCVGLSKNPYLTAREKKDHILWYRDYFGEKREMLKEYMQQEKPKPKQIKEAN